MFNVFGGFSEFLSMTMHLKACTALKSKYNDKGRDRNRSNNILLMKVQAKKKRDYTKC